MARASAKRGRRPRSNARTAQRVADEQPTQAVPEPEASAAETPATPAPARRDKKPAVEKKPARKPEPKPERRHTSSSDDAMFFMRLRTHAKWVFAVLAGIFALSFVALGVGTGVSGSSLGDVIRDIFGGDSGTSLSEAQQKVEDNPQDVEALRALATAQNAAGQPAAAAATLEKLIELRPNDTAVAAQLAGIYDQQARAATAEAQALIEQTNASFAQTVFSFPGSTGFLGALAGGPVDLALSRQASERSQQATDRAQELFGKSALALERITKAKPDEPTGYIQLGQALAAAGQNEKAITAYEKFLELAPDDPNAEFVQSQLELLQQQGEVVQG